MGIQKKIEAWQAAGLITAKQAKSLLTHEQTHKNGRYMAGLVGVALFAILCGVLAIVAANWMDIPGEIKLGVHVLVNAAVAIALYRMDKPFYREGLTLLLFGLTLTLIALIGQVFQLGGGWANALILWMGVTAPLMLAFGETRITAVPWILVFLTTVIMAMEEYLPDPGAVREFILMVGMMVLLPLALIADGNLRIVQQYKPVWGAVFVKAGFLLMVLAATLTSIVWYGPLSQEYADMAAGAGWSVYAVQAVMIVLLLGALGVQYLYARIRNFYRNNIAHKAAARIAALSTFFSMLPFWAGVEGGSAAATLHILLYWMALGYIAQTQGWSWLVTMAILVLSGRIFIAYCELFGDLMTTGYALIGGGIIVLVLMWGALRLSQFLKRKNDATA